MTRDGGGVGQRRGSAVVDDPLTVRAWLANTLGARGIALEADHIVIPGAVCAMVPIAQGDVVSLHSTASAP